MAAPLSSNLTWSLANPLWASTLNPIVANAILSGRPVSIALKSGANIINHELGRNMQGWFVTDVNGIATIYRSQPLNNLTLTLMCSAPVTVNLWVY